MVVEDQEIDLETVVVAEAVLVVLELIFLLLHALDYQCRHKDIQ